LNRGNMVAANQEVQLLGFSPLRKKTQRRFNAMASPNGKSIAFPRYNPRKPKLMAPTPFTESELLQPPPCRIMNLGAYSAAC
jgi:hypothetical protein